MFGVGPGRRVARVVAVVLAGRVVDADVQKLLDHVPRIEVDLLEAIAAQIVVFALLGRGAIVRKLAEIPAGRAVGRGRRRGKQRQPQSDGHWREGPPTAAAIRPLDHLRGS